MQNVHSKTDLNLKSLIRCLLVCARTPLSTKMAAALNSCVESEISPKSKRLLQDGTEDSAQKKVKTENQVHDQVTPKFSFDAFQAFCLAMRLKVHAIVLWSPASWPCFSSRCCFIGIWLLKIKVWISRIIIQPQLIQNRFDRCI